MNKIIILIPCYNEDQNIVDVVQNIHDHVASNDFFYNNTSINYIILNDCSNDNTLDICMKNDFNYLSLPVNLGIGGCVQAGYLYALERGYDIAIQHDGDGQHDPRYFKDIISPLILNQADIAIGSRFLDKKGFQSTWLRRFGIGFLSKLIFLCTGLQLHDVTSGYRAVNRKYIKVFAEHYAQDYPEPESIMDAALNKAKIIEVPVIMHKRKKGMSSIVALNPIYYMIKVSLSILLHRVIASKKAV